MLYSGSCVSGLTCNDPLNMGLSNYSFQCAQTHRNTISHQVCVCTCMHVLKVAYRLARENITSTQTSVWAARSSVSGRDQSVTDAESEQPLTFLRIFILQSILQHVPEVCFTFSLMGRGRLAGTKEKTGELSAEASFVVSVHQLDWLDSRALDY